jgi:hypothetical protein
MTLQDSNILTFTRSSPHEHVFIYACRCQQFAVHAKLCCENFGLSQYKLYLMASELYVLREQYSRWFHLLLLCGFRFMYERKHVKSYKR